MSQKPLSQWQLYLLQMLGEKQPQHSRALRLQLQARRWSGSLAAWYQLLGRLQAAGLVILCDAPDPAIDWPSNISWYQLTEAGKGALQGFQDGMRGRPGKK